MSGGRKKRGFFGKLRLLFLWLVLVVCIAIQAPVFPHIVRCIVKVEAWRRGVNVSIGAVEGSLFDPVVLRNSVWSYASPTGAQTRLEIRSARGWFAWSNVFPAPLAGWVRSGAEKLGWEPFGGNGACWQRLELDGVSAKVELPLAGPAEKQLDSSDWLRLRLPVGEASGPLFIDLRNVDLVVQRGAEFVRLERMKFIASAIEPGHLTAAQFAVKTSWFEKTFRDVRGRTAIEGANVTIANIALAPELKVRTFTLSFAKLSKGQLSMKTILDAFGGKLEAEAESVPAGRDLSLSANGRFSSLNFGTLCTFLEISEAAGGIIREGSFVFHGSPRDIARGDTRLRLEADRIQWESRQWDSLILGLTIMDQRLGVPECHLKQGANELSFSGTLAMPQAGAKWWELPFELKVNASIRNLTELSALLLPEFTYTAGELLLRGTVGGTGAKPGGSASYDGQIIVNGSGLKYRTAPLEQLTGALVFKGREIQIINAQFENDDDYLRASGTVSLDHGGFDGRVRLSVADLKTYGALLGPPILPTPIAGGATIAWTGKWVGDQRKGDFTGKLRRFHLLGSSATHPLDAELAGTIEKEQIFFDRFKLNQNGTTLTAAIGVGPSLLNLSDLRLQKNGETWLEGDALLPLDVWQRWPQFDFATLLNEDTVGRIRLTAKNLRLADAALLTGYEWPISGVLNGTITADGSLKNTALGGSLTLSAAKLPLDKKGTFITDSNAEFSLANKTISLTKAEGRHAGGIYSLTGKLHLENPRAPMVEALGAGTDNQQPFTLKINGPAAGTEIILERTPLSPPPTPAEQNAP